MPEVARERLNAALRRSVLDRPEDQLIGIEWGLVTDQMAFAYVDLASGDRVGLITPEHPEVRLVCRTGLLWVYCARITTASARDDGHARG